MKDNHDIEDVLKKSGVTPSPRVKDRVLSEFSRALGNNNARGVKASFWRTPIPLYAVAASVVILVGLSFVAGQKTSRPESPPAAVQELSQPEEIKTAQDIGWTVTARDLL